MKLPAIQFYVGDWRKSTDIQSLSYHDRGVWFELLCFMHESKVRGKLLVNGKALPDEAVIRILGLDKQVGLKTIQTLLESGVADRCADTGALMSRRMVRDEEIRRIRQECGKMGGNPYLVKQKSTTEDIHSTEDEDEDEDTPKEGEFEGKPKPAEAPELIYAEYPKKAARPDAIRAIVKAIKKIGFCELLAKTRAYALAVQGEDFQFVPYPASWFNAERYNDDPATWKRGESKPAQAKRPPTISELKTQRDAIESMLNALRNKHGSGPLAKPWSDEDKAKAADMKKRISDINTQISIG